MMRIGVHPNNLHLRLARLWPGSFAGFEPEFFTYGEGRDTASLLERGKIHFGGTGSTPPIEADARGLDVRYIAASAPRPANGAIFARADGDIRTVADLAGKRISLVDGSFHTYLLARSLEGEGLGLPDVTRIESGNHDSLKELLEGRVDAWVAMSPRLEKNGGKLLKPEAFDEWQKGAQGVWQDFAGIVGGIDRIKAVQAS